MPGILSKGRGVPYITGTTIKKNTPPVRKKNQSECRNTVIYIRPVKQNQNLLKLNPNGYKLRANFYHHNTVGHTLKDSGKKCITALNTQQSAKTSVHFSLKGLVALQTPPCQAK